MAVRAVGERDERGHRPHPEQREAYQEKSNARVFAGQRRLASAIAGGAPLYQRPATNRRLDDEAPENREEAEMLLDPASRLGEDGVYVR